VNRAGKNTPEPSVARARYSGGDGEQAVVVPSGGAERAPPTATKRPPPNTG
jgi:hypothetical protein